MKKFIYPIVVGLVFGIIGFAAGHLKGINDTKTEIEFQKKYGDIELLKNDLKNREIADITSFLHGKAGIETIDEGGLFDVKNVQYLSGDVSNSAAIATAKDIKINVDFYTKTKTKIGSQEIVIYEFVKPGQKIKFKEKINLPEKVEEFEFQFTEAKAE
jgi:hypothetical protein